MLFILILRNIGEVLNMMNKEVLDRLEKKFGEDVSDLIYCLFRDEVNNKNDVNGVINYLVRCVINDCIDEYSINFKDDDKKYLKYNKEYLCKYMFDSCKLEVNLLVSLKNIFDLNVDCLDIMS